MDNFLKSKTTTRLIVIIGLIIIALVIFQAGVFVGYKHGEYSRARNYGYGRGMDDPHSMFAPFMRGNDDASPHGAVGEIVKLALPNSILIKGRDSAEQVVTLSATTTIRFIHGEASPTDLKTGQRIIVIGSPGDNGQIDAVFIRIFPVPDATTTNNLNKNEIY